jgi:uncharacterized protein DUF3857/transglutaminase superfamily protein
MKLKSCCNRKRWSAVIRLRAVLFCAGMFLALNPPLMRAGDAPQWMHAVTNAPLPTHDEKTDAVLLYSEENVAVQSTDKIKIHIRRAYKILRPGGRDYGVAMVYFGAHSKVTSMHGWCIPAEGKDYEVKDKEALEISAPKIEGSELISDVKAKVLRIPAPDPGNIVGYEYETEEQPLVLQQSWHFQHHVPVREGHFTLQLPAGWEYKATWLNHAEVAPSSVGNGQWQWVVSDVKAIRSEEDMPPLTGVAGHMIVSFFPPGGPAGNGFSNWQEMGNWYQRLTAGREDATPDIKQKVTALTASAATPLDKMRTLASFVQSDIRYVAIELGIGGFQPHPAGDVFQHRYGDCKDKVTLMGSMLHEIGVESYYVVINTERGSITPDTPASTEFDHMIMAIKLPDGVNDASLAATMKHAKAGTLLFFDPTNEMIPFGQIGGYLQANYGLLVTPGGGELVQLPKQPSALNSIARTGKLVLDANGTLRGEVNEVRMGDRAWSQRAALHSATREQDKIKPIEQLLADSISSFRITKASVVNLQQTDLPFGFNYSFDAENYAKNTGGLMLVRPRVVGSKSRAILETKEPRQFPVEFEGPAADSDNFEIALPAGYVVDDLPPPVDADYSFASYHSKTELHENAIRYTRKFEVKELSVPVNQADELKKFYRIIANDERNTAVLRPK